MQVMQLMPSPLYPKYNTQEAQTGAMFSTSYSKLKYHTKHVKNKNIITSLWIERFKINISTSLPQSQSEVLSQQTS